jgi:hypothetical protein
MRTVTLDALHKEGVVDTVTHIIRAPLDAARSGEGNPWLVLFHNSKKLYKVHVTYYDRTDDVDGKY